MVDVRARECNKNPIVKYLRYILCRNCIYCSPVWEKEEKKVRETSQKWNKIQVGDVINFHSIFSEDRQKSFHFPTVDRLRKWMLVMQAAGNARRLRRIQPPPEMTSTYITESIP